MTGLGCGAQSHPHTLSLLFWCFYCRDPSVHLAGWGEAHTDPVLPSLSFIPPWLCPCLSSQGWDLLGAHLWILWQVEVGCEGNTQLQTALPQPSILQDCCCHLCRGRKMIMDVAEDGMDLGLQLGGSSEINPMTNASLSGDKYAAPIKNKYFRREG